MEHCKSLMFIFMLKDKHFLQILCFPTEFSSIIVMKSTNLRHRADVNAICARCHKNRENRTLMFFVPSVNRRRSSVLYRREKKG